MKNDKVFEKLVGLARQELHPAVDVADNVLDILASRQLSRTYESYRPLMWITAVSYAAAACVAIAAFIMYKAGQVDSVAQISEMISWVAQ